MRKSASFSTTECRFASRPALLFIQADLIADHCDELAVRGFSSQVVDGIAKVAVQGIHIAAVPQTTYIGINSHSAARTITGLNLKLFITYS